MPTVSHLETIVTTRFSVTSEDGLTTKIVGLQQPLRIESLIADQFTGAHAFLIDQLQKLKQQVIDGQAQSADASLAPPLAEATSQPD
jgi:hypothetical protein